MVEPERFATLWELIEQAAERWPNDRMLVSRQGDSATFGSYHQRVVAMAAGLHDAGVRSGQVVSWILPTWVDTVVLAGALSRLGAVQNPIIGIYRDREVGFCVDQTKADHLITTGSFGGFDFAAMGRRIVANNPGLHHLVVHAGAFPEGNPATLPPVEPAGPEDTRWMCYTSGTTADPKGARHTDQSVGATIHHMGRRLNVEHGDRYSLVFPFPHIGGIGLLVMALHLGCTHLLDDTVDPVETIAFLSEQDCTHAGTGTPFYLMFLAAQAKLDTPLFPNLKVNTGGGAPIAPALHYRVKAELGGAGIASGWGMTECPVLTNGFVTDTDDHLAHTEGTALPGTEVRAVDDDGNVCAPGVQGELRCRGTNTMLGYVDASLDEDAFDDEGWYRTGDLGMLDAEGYVTITGRLKDIIIRNGENVSAKEVEDLLFAMDQVDDAVVIGLPNERTGEMVCAVVVPAAGSELSLDQLTLLLQASGLRNQALPERLELVSSLPRSPAGKVDKRALEQAFT